ncbi:MAG: GTP cyclohydrolase I FolE2 [Methylibium sp.]|jgi:GTP cyclohydrolase I|uniref:GTP cyclohydrolase I FolE2 n=1 Tax=Methylibium sp. TaxID=2067992 RepID=UPI00274799D5|nr:GTP cyclohydrolase I FolE2 [Methylibium sp.]
MNDMTHVSALGLTQHIPDTQSERDERHLAIQRVGVKEVRYPLTVRIGEQLSPTVANWSLDVALPAEQKGTHMSRFVAWLDALSASGKPLDEAALRDELAVMLDKLHAVEGRIEARFPFFIRKHAPVSGVSSLLDYQGAWIAERRAGVGTTVWCEVVVPVKSLCPCSKEISDYGAHNQRSHVTIRAELMEPPGDRRRPPPPGGGESTRERPVVDSAVELGFDALVRFAEESASSEIWGLLKRPDEKWITERAYENPKFVEDLVRDVALRLDADSRIGRYRVEVENFESIHNHSAFAVIERE